ncbi:MAG TPA: Gfo/Idh/MocA family oxidoreductase, partial [Candidatus Limnocylindria bacterium]|nr:Gfo/Idh/MocA family oxidoreductase [Candidatus Limnocylindria bacterium]
MPRHYFGSAFDPLPRRQFITTLGAAAAGCALTGCQTSRPRKISANEKLNIGFIGVAGQAGYSISNLKDQNIVALCDVDSDNLGKVAAQFPAAQTHRDFRQLIDQKGIDAIVIATPDHTHAVATAAALRSGRHVYCEKPLTHTVSEGRAITELARKTGLVTQIGTQIHAGNNYRRVVELVQSGAIGPVREVHVWVGSNYGGGKLPTDQPPIPPNLDWDLWLGPVTPRPYHPEFVPFKWRNWWHFGGGSLADFGCHFMDLPFWALQLKYPMTVEPISGPAVDAESTPTWLIVRYDFPARKNENGKLPLPPLRLTWYHGGKRPEIVSDELFAKFKGGVLFIGEKGMLVSDYGKHALLPEEKFKDFT